MKLSLLPTLVILAASSEGENYAPATTGTLAGQVGGYRTLVLLDSISVKRTHSDFFQFLEDRNHEISFKSSSSRDIELFKLGECLYDNIVLFSPKAKFENDELNLNSVFDFIEKCGNMLITGSPDMSKSVRHVAALVGIDFDPHGSEVFDHFSYSAILNSVSNLHNVIETKNVIENEHILGKAASHNIQIIFSGISHTVASDNIMVSPILKAEDTAYSFSRRKKTHGIHTLASKNILVSAVQARNNNRIVVSGSLDMFSNRYFNIPGSGNKEFCTEISKWAFAERGILRVSSLSHYRKDGSAAELLLKQKDRSDQPASLFPEPEIAKNSQVYRVMEDITYNIAIEYYDVDKGGWLPFSASDVQLEFVMLDPYERITLENDPNTGVFSKTFTLPDKYGIFKFRIMYRRAGLTVLLVNTQVSIRPFKHNEHERFIPSGYPYFTGVFSVMIGFFVFMYFFLNAESELSTEKKLK